MNELWSVTSTYEEHVIVIKIVLSNRNNLFSIQLRIFFVPDPDPTYIN